MSQMSGTEISKDKAMTLALLLESIASILETEAPSTLRMLISLRLMLAWNKVIPRIPRLAIAMATPAKVLNMR